MYVAKFMVSYLVRFYLFKIILPLYQKPYSDFTKITLRFSQNHWLIFTTSLADFHRITLRLCQNRTPTLPKSHSDFHKTTGWFSQHHWLILTKSHADFAKITLRFYQNRRLIFTKSLTDFRKNEGWFWSPRLLLYCTPFQNRALAHCASCLSEGFSSFVTSLSGSAHCLCPFLWKKPSVVYR